MKIRSIVILLFCMMFSMAASAYQPRKDMVCIERLLSDAAKLPKDSNLMLHFGKQFLNVPYVAHTLDRNTEEEKLVVNTRELDCTTFVENVLALTLCAQRGETKFTDFENQLQQIRYITLPLLKPTSIFVLTISIYAGLAMFLESYMMWGGNGSPRNIGLTIVGYLYRRGIEKNQMGYASAVGLVLLVIALVINAVQLVMNGTFKKEK